MFALVFPLLAAVWLCHADPPSRSRALDEGVFETTSDGAAIDGQILTARTPPRHLRVAILPDRTTGRAWGIPYLQDAIEDLERLNPDAVFTVGDLVQGYTRDPRQWDKEADEYLSIVDGLSAMFYPVPGNHDVISGARDPSDRRFIDRYRTRFGPVHYAAHFDLGTIIVLFSDEALDDRNVMLSETQLGWLEGVLESAPADRPIVLLMHRPLWRYGEVNWDERVHPLLVKHGVDAVIAGHFHALHREPDRDGIEYHLLGVCGGAIDQHPLTGQFHHLTMLDLGPGDRVKLMHMPVGATLPDDVVTRVDQDRAFRLKRAYSTAEVAGTIPDPRSGPVDAKVSLRLRNPTDVPVVFVVEPSRRIERWSVAGSPFTAATPLDTRNEATTDYETPFTITEFPDQLSIEPGETKTISLRVRAAACDHSPQPPQLLITATFTDSKDRSVPVVLHRRLPIERSMNAAVPQRFPISAWRHSVYELPEPDSTVVIDLTERSPRLAFTLRDDHLAFERDRLIETRHNPMSDLVRIVLSMGEHSREFLLAPGGPAGDLIDAASGTIHPRTWTIEPADDASFELLLEIPTVQSSAVTAIQIEVADNDDTYHTQWRRLAPPGTSLRVERNEE
jgi:predicted phosphodiesterase